MLAVGGCQFGGRMEWKYWREYGGPRFLFAIRLGDTSYSFCSDESIRFYISRDSFPFLGKFTRA